MSLHISSNDAASKSSCARKQLTIELINQPTQLPDLNVNDLSFFWTLNCLWKKIVAKNVEGLIKAVGESYDKIPPCTLDNAFIALMAQTNKILHHRGKNSLSLIRVVASMRRR